MTQLEVNGYIITLDEDIEFSFNAGQIANLSLSQSNYTESFKIPRTSQDNVRAFEGLGIPTDQSSIPYAINNTNVLQNYNVIYSGTLVILKTDPEYYNATVISGTWDVFQLLGDKTFYDISWIRSLITAKNANTVDNLNTYTDPFKDVIYAIANYGGITHIIDSNTVYVNVDCMPIAFHIMFLWNRIFESVNIPNDLSTLSGTDTGNQYFTFPYPPLSDSVAPDVVTFEGTNPSAAGNNPITGSNSYVNVSGGGWTISGRALTATVSRQYLFEFPNGFVGQWYENLSKPKKPLTVTLTKNGTPFASFNSDISLQPDRNPQQVVEFFNAGDVFNFTLSSGDYTGGLTWYTADNLLRISTTKLSDQALKEMLSFKLSDYVKEFMWKFALIGYRQPAGNMLFRKIGDVLNTGDSIDWSDKYIERVEETYDLGYSQNNYLRHKYVNAGADYYDGNIQSNNLNSPTSRDMVTSNVFVPSQNTQAFSLGGSSTTSNTVGVNGLVTYSASDNGEIKTEKRNFWMQTRLWPQVNVYYGSSISSDRKTSFGKDIYISSAYGEGFNSNYWAPLNRLTYNTRVHVIDLNLTEVDIMTLDQTRPYFFKQEAAFYMLNELRYKKGEKATGKFTKING